MPYYYKTSHVSNQAIVSSCSRGIWAKKNQINIINYPVTLVIYQLQDVFLNFSAPHWNSNWTDKIGTLFKRLKYFDLIFLSVTGYANKTKYCTTIVNLINHIILNYNHWRISHFFTIFNILLPFMKIILALKCLIIGFTQNVVHVATAPSRIDPRFGVI